MIKFSRIYWYDVKDTNLEENVIDWIIGTQAYLEVKKNMYDYRKKIYIVYLNSSFNLKRKFHYKKDLIEYLTKLLKR